MRSTLPALTIFSLLLTAILVFGCLGIGGTTGPTPPAKEVLANEFKNTSANITSGTSLEVQVEGDTNVSIAKVYVLQNGDRVRFPTRDYESPFENLGLYSDAFIVLNNSHVKFMDNEETLWLTPMIRSDGTEQVLFNAIYERKFSS